MLLDITPSGYELQRKMLLSHSSSIRGFFMFSLVLIPLAIYIGLSCSNDAGDDLNQDYLKNVAMIVVNKGNAESQGTAFLVADAHGQPTGYLFTARHVVADATNNQVSLTFPFITDENDEPLTTTASIVWETSIPFDGADIKTLLYDVALLKLDAIADLPEDVQGFTIGGNVVIKDPIAIYGFPSSQGYAVDGTVSNTEYSESKDLMTLSFQIDRGLSGAPVYNEETGEVLGIAIASEKGTDLGNIALKMSRVIDLLEENGTEHFSNLFP